MFIRCLYLCCFLALVGRAPSLFAAFDLSITIDGSLTSTQRTNLENALDAAEMTWEGLVTGYQPGVSIGGINVTVVPSAATGLADSQVTGTVTEGGFVLATDARIRINPAAINFWSNWDGTGPTPPNTEFAGVNFLDEIMTHEMGHALGIGNLWTNNNLYVTGTGHYTGEHGLEAFLAEFDSTATFVQVELAGGPARANFHWDQIVRSSAEEGNPADPWPLDPRIGITDDHGRDFAFEMMTATFDPDYGEPFVGQTTVQSLRDLGFTIVPEPGSTALLLVAAACWASSRQRTTVSQRS
ncbi:MAG: PEP-CTERM sorting domain-containing protein [Bythopirellula sp.]